MPTAPPNLAEPDYLYPQRYWWTKRIAALIAVVLLITLGVRIWWGRAIQARFGTRIAALHAAGEPILPADFNQPIVPDEQNYVHFLRKALAALNYDTYGPSGSDKEFPAYLPMPPEWHKLAREAEAGNAKSLQLIRQARQLTQVDWGVEYKSPTMKILLPGLNDMRQLANVLGDVAIYAHLNGRDDEAVERLMDLLSMTDALNAQPILVSHLVATGILAMGSARALLIAPGLEVSEDPSVHSARRAQVKALINALVLRTDRALIFTMQGERMMQLDSNQWLSSRSTLLRPMFQEDALHTLDYMSSYVTPATAPTTTPTWVSGPSAVQSTADLPRLLSSVLSPSLGRAMDSSARGRAEAMAAGISLAARLYQLDHDGKWPPTLEALVPDYLSAVPVNPRSKKGAPIRYVLHDSGTRPLVYIEDYEGTLASDLARLPRHPLYDWQSGAAQFRDLSRFIAAPATMPASQSSE